MRVFGKSIVKSRVVVINCEHKKKESHRKLTENIKPDPLLNGAVGQSQVLRPTRQINTVVFSRWCVRYGTGGQVSHI